MQEKPFNPFIAAIWRRLAETMLVEPSQMAITPQQVVDNLQAMFGNIRGRTPASTGLSVFAAWVVLGGPVWHAAPTCSTGSSAERSCSLQGHARPDSCDGIAFGAVPRRPVPARSVRR